MMKQQTQQSFRCLTIQGLLLLASLWLLVVSGTTSATTTVNVDDTVSAAVDSTVSAANNGVTAASAASATNDVIQEGTCSNTNDQDECKAGSNETDDDDDAKNNDNEEQTNNNNNVPDFSKYDCQDEHKNCEAWASQGECEGNPGYMLKKCKRSCEICPDQVDAEFQRQKALADMPEEDLKHGLDFGVHQELQAPTFNVFEDAVSRRIVESRTYMRNNPIKNKELRELSVNTHAQCTAWAEAGECEKNPGFMKTKCCPACFSCSQMTVEGRCPIDPNATAAWEPGDLNKMFERLTSEPYMSKYDINILSRDPWVITLENVLSAEEAERLIELGAAEGYKRSSDVGKKLADGTFDSKVSDFRTSMNAWCQGDCYLDPIAKGVIDRISNITGIDDQNSEYLQMLRYEPGQYYKAHHDYIIHNKDRQQGVRILTVFLYLNDVEAGGGTNFDKLNITVQPKLGRALIWPSVKDQSPHQKDGRTTHQALPVEAGVKYGANAWFHQFDFKTPHKQGCTS